MEAADLLKLTRDGTDSLRNLTFSDDSVASNKPMAFALVCETIRYMDVLEAVFKRARVNTASVARDANLLLVLAYELLLGKKNIRGAGRVKRSLMELEPKLHAALETMCKEAGVDAAEGLLPEKRRRRPEHSRHVRVNALRWTVGDAEAYLVEKYPSFTEDADVQGVLTFPPGTDFHADERVVDGSLILQDKSSCFPASALVSTLETMDCPDQIRALDCCAAPGNKTSHLASLVSSRCESFYALDRSESRCRLLEKRMVQSLADQVVTVKHCDYLATDPKDLNDPHVILLDPSCSGTGMPDHFITDDVASGDGAFDSKRLEKLVSFQTESLTRSLTCFPSALVVSYSTCSILKEENDQVVNAVLDVPGVSREWELAPNVLPNWRRRTNKGLCVAVDPKLDDSNGFFLAVFRRKQLVKAKDPKKARMAERRKRKRKAKKSAERLKKVKQ